jgi:transposase
MAIADAAGLPVSLAVASASPHEVTLVEETLEQRFMEDVPERLVGDKAYDSDPLDQRMQEQGIEMIAPNRSNRKKTQDGRRLRRYKRRWKVERLFAWLQHFRRVLVRWDYYPQNYLGFVQIAAAIIFVRQMVNF